ncbi:MAG: single-stranded DNA-binding protein [Candidatus Omnitrophica bacterium CG11_big_fil_rev_8_21_14_0_20_63_9]|nr:MAG: single-stranded DNA-binding protein [Candidatus Omnitrophica bacterium CG11_big_fil_rev_8_21_14_0_20_63_9]
MVSLNRVLLIGNLTKDPELRYTPSGTPVANLRLAVNSSFKGQDGQRKEETCFVTIVVWSKQAELCNQYLKKGRSVFIEGRLIYRQWEAEGKTRSTMEVRADRVQFLGGPAGAGGGRGEAEETRVADNAPADAPDEAADADVPF